MSWSNDKELSSGADAISCETLSQKKNKKTNKQIKILTYANVKSQELSPPKG